MRALAIPLFFLLANAASAQLAVGMLTNGNTEFAFTSYPTSHTSTAGTASFRTGGPNSTNHLYHTWWYWRLDTDAREFAFHNGTATQLAPASVYAGDRAVLSWPNVDNRGLAARLEVRVYSVGAAGGVCVQKMTVTNNTGNPITLNLFGYNDLNQCGLFNNEAVVVGNNLQSISDFMCGTVAQVFAPGADHHEVASFPLVRLRLIDPVADTLNDSGLPYAPGDYSGAFQWQDRAVAPGGEFSAYMVLSEDLAQTGCARLARASTYGVAKAGTHGLPSWNTNLLPMVGLPISLEISNGLAGSPPQLYLGGGATSLYYAPFDVTLLIDVTQPHVSFFGATFDGLHRSITSFTLPNLSTLCGVTLNAQAFYIDPGATRGVTHTGGLRWNVGTLF